jgi:hypothetical protein
MREARRCQAAALDAVKTVAGNAKAEAMDVLEREAVEHVIRSIGAIDHPVLKAVVDELASRRPAARECARRVGFMRCSRPAACPVGSGALDFGRARSRKVRGTLTRKGIQCATTRWGRPACSSPSFASAR